MNPNFTSSRKFTKRPDLTFRIRFFIACLVVTAKNTGAWGAVTAIASDFSISGTFAYMLAKDPEDAGVSIFEDPQLLNPIPVVKELKKSCKSMLSLRLEGKCSIGAISALLLWKDPVINIVAPVR